MQKCLYISDAVCWALYSHGNLSVPGSLSLNNACCTWVLSTDSRERLEIKELWGSDISRTCILGGQQLNILIKVEILSLCNSQVLKDIIGKV